jgi:hypothetical protein
VYNAYKRIEMVDRGCTPERLIDLYVCERKSQREIRELFNITDERVLNRWFKESGITKRVERGKYKFNKNFFDKIDNEEKAYWMGFIWCDGYVCKRERNGNTHFEFKLDLEVGDIDHIYKFREALESNHPIKKYTYKSNFDETKESKVARLYISNKYFGSTLHSDYGLIANRFNVNKLINKIPEKLVRHFIRGAVDADGYLGKYIINASRGDKIVKEEKMLIALFTYKDLLTFIQEHLLKVGLQQGELKTSKRHEGRDGYCEELKYCGRTQVPKIIKYLYGDSSVYLERKFKTAQKIIADAKERGLKLDEI